MFTLLGVQSTTQPSSSRCNMKFSIDNLFRLTLHGTTLIFIGKLSCFNSFCATRKTTHRGSRFKGQPISPMIELVGDTTAIGIAADVEKLDAIPIDHPNEVAATGSKQAPMVAKKDSCLSTWLSKNCNKRLFRAYKRSIQQNTASTFGHEKSPVKTVFTGLCSSDADGTRTRNLRIDSPGL